jgi:hypothetical protein
MMNGDKMNWQKVVDILNLASSEEEKIAKMLHDSSGSRADDFVTQRMTRSAIYRTLAIALKAGIDE